MIKPYFENENGRLLNCDVLEGLKSLPDESVHCCVTSPPYYGLRDYGVDGQIGLEETPEAFVQKLVDVFREVKRVLRDDGTVWLNLGDSYAANRGYQVPDSKHCDVGNNKGMKASVFNLKPKDLIGIPWRVAFALQADGWYLRQDIIWHKPNPMPESVTDRCTKSHEYIFLLSKSAKYFYDAVAIREENKDTYNGKRGTTQTRNKLQSAMRDFSTKEKMNCYSTQGRNRRDVWSVDERRDFIAELAEELSCYGIDKEAISISLLNVFCSHPDVWSIPTKSFKEAHFATFPPKLIEPCILAGCPAGGTVLDPFFGSGTTGLVAYQHDRKFIGIELNPEYCAIAYKRLAHETQQLKLFK